MRVTAAIAPHRGAPFEVADLELDDPRPSEVRVRFVATGVCHTDANIRDQLLPTPLPAVLGHEGAGIVEAVGADVTTVRTGDHVVLCANSCGSCRRCLSGELAYCDDLFARNFGARRPDGSTAFSLDGTPVSSHFFGQSSFSTVSNVSSRSVVRVRDDVDLSAVAPLGCGIQTGAGTVLNELRAHPGSSLAVFGSGAVGGGAILGAVLAGCTTIVALDVHDARLDLARQLGATHTINTTTQDAAGEIAEITAGRGLDSALDTTGRPDVLRTAVDALGTRGTAALVGASASGTEVPFEIGDSLNKGWRFTTVIQGSSVPHTFIPALIDLWQQGRFPFDRMIRRYPFADINQAFDDAASGATVKPVLTH